MALKTQKELVQKVRNLLVLPGVCTPDKRGQILQFCEVLPEEELKNLAEALVVRYRSLIRLVHKVGRGSIVEAKQEIDIILRKYGIQTT